MALDRRMAALIAEHNRQVHRLAEEFQKQNPTVEFWLDDSTGMTDEQDRAWRELTAAEDKRFAEARDSLAAQMRAEHAARAS